MTPLPAHPKQYVLGPAPVLVGAEWTHVGIGDGLVLSCCPRLRRTPLQSRNGVHYELLGLAVPTDAPMSSLPDIFHTKHSSEIEAWTGFWAGQWVLISPDRCWQDASGSLAVNHRSLDGQVWLSSSVVLLSDHLPDAAPAARIPWQVKPGDGIDWVPLPFTTRAGIYKLLPQRSIDPRDGAASALRFAPPTPSNTAQALAAALTTALLNWARCGFSRLCITLTAGLDTRTVLAAACAAGLSYEAVTTLYSSMAWRDYLLPPRLARRVGAPHRFMRSARVDPSQVAARMAVISEHVDGIDTHPQFGRIARFDRSRADDFDGSSAHGSCFEFGRTYYWHKFHTAGLSSASPTADAILKAFGIRTGWTPQPPELWKEAMRLWLRSLNDAVPFAFDWRDRFYLEQCLASWNCNLNRAEDFFDRTGFAPANSLWIYHLLTQGEPKERRQGVLQKAAIRLMAPRLLELPVNPISSREFFRRIKRAVGRRLTPDDPKWR